MSTLCVEIIYEKPNDCRNIGNDVLWYTDFEEANVKVNFKLNRLHLGNEGQYKTNGSINLSAQYEQTEGHQEGHQEIVRKSTAGTERRRNKNVRL